MGNKALTAGIGILTAASVAVVPMMAVSGFDLYEPPNRLVISWNAPAYDDYPYRAVFLGGYKHTGAIQGYDANYYMILSKTPTSDLFEFSYEEGSRGNIGNTGYIKCTAKLRNTVGWDYDALVVYGSQSGMPEQLNIPMNTTSGLSQIDSFDRVYFYFDFYYQCCGELEVNGARNVTDAPYGYILTCTDENGSGGGSSSGSSSGGSSSGGSSSGNPDYSSKPPGWKDPTESQSEDGPGSGWDQSSERESNPDEYPWEESSNVPDLDWYPETSEYPPGTEGDTGERGDTWTLPEYSLPDVDIETEDFNIPSPPSFDFPGLYAPDFDAPGGTAPPAYEYEPEVSGSWPPPFPGLG